MSDLIPTPTNLLLGLERKVKREVGMEGEWMRWKMRQRLLVQSWRVAAGLD